MYLIVEKITNKYNGLSDFNLDVCDSELALAEMTHRNNEYPNENRQLTAYHLDALPKVKEVHADIKIVTTDPENG